MEPTDRAQKMPRQQISAIARQLSRRHSPHKTSPDPHTNAAKQHGHKAEPHPSEIRRSKWLSDVLSEGQALQSHEIRALGRKLQLYPDLCAQLQERLGESALAVSLLSAAQGSLRGVQLLGADLSGADLSQSVLDGADLSGCNLQGADLCGTYMGSCRLDGANLMDVAVNMNPNRMHENDAQLLRWDSRYQSTLTCTQSGDALLLLSSFEDNGKCDVQMLNVTQGRFLPLEKPDMGLPMVDFTMDLVRSGHGTNTYMSFDLDSSQFQLVDIWTGETKLQSNLSFYHGLNPFEDLDLDKWTTRILSDFGDGVPTEQLNTQDEVTFEEENLFIPPSSTLSARGRKEGLCFQKIKDEVFDLMTKTRDESFNTPGMSNSAAHNQQQQQLQQSRRNRRRYNRIVSLHETKQGLFIFVLNNQVRIYDTKSTQNERVIPSMSNGTISRATMLENVEGASGPVLALVFGCGSIFLYDVLGEMDFGVLYNCTPNFPEHICSVKASDGYDRMAIGDRLGHIHLWDVKRDVAVWTVHSGGGWTLSIINLQNNDDTNPWVISAHCNNTVYIWDASSGAKLKEISDFQSSMIHMSGCVDGRNDRWLHRWLEGDIHTISRLIPHQQPSSTTNGFGKSTQSEITVQTIYQFGSRLYTFIEDLHVNTAHHNSTNEQDRDEISTAPHRSGCVLVDSKKTEGSEKRMQETKLSLYKIGATGDDVDYVTYCEDNMADVTKRQSVHLARLYEVGIKGVEKNITQMALWLNHAEEFQELAQRASDGCPIALERLRMTSILLSQLGQAEHPQACILLGRCLEATDLEGALRAYVASLTELDSSGLAELRRVGIPACPFLEAVAIRHTGFNDPQPRPEIYLTLAQINMDNNLIDTAVQMLLSAAKAMSREASDILFRLINHSEVRVSTLVREGLKEMAHQVHPFHIHSPSYPYINLRYAKYLLAVFESSAKTGDDNSLLREATELLIKLLICGDGFSSDGSILRRLCCEYASEDDVHVFRTLESELFPPDRSSSSDPVNYFWGRYFALNFLGMCYERGWGTEVDIRKASRCYRLSDFESHDTEVPLNIVRLHKLVIDGHAGAFPALTELSITRRPNGLLQRPIGVSFVIDCINRSDDSICEYLDAQAYSECELSGESQSRFFMHIRRVHILKWLMILNPYNNELATILIRLCCAADHVACRVAIELGSYFFLNNRSVHPRLVPLIALCHIFGLGVSQNKSLGFGMLLDMGNKGKAVGIRILQVLVQQGSSDAFSALTSIAYGQKSRTPINRTAAAIVASCFENGWGVGRNIAEALKWSIMADAASSKESLRALQEMMDQGNPSAIAAVRNLAGMKTGKTVFIYPDAVSIVKDYDEQQRKAAELNEGGCDVGGDDVETHMAGMDELFG